MANNKFTNRSLWLVGLSCLLICITLVVAYLPVMFNFFCSDDFYIVGWLNACKQAPATLFQAVYEGTPYYRPLLNVLLFLEYLLCGINSVSLRLVSLMYLLITAIVIWLLVSEFDDANVQELSEKDGQEKKQVNVTRSLFSAGIFLVYPLHTEPINWFVCTTELLVSLFILLSFLFFARANRFHDLLSKCLSYALAICAFLTKEIAVILPVILFLYALIYSSGENNKDADLSLNNFALRQRLSRAIKSTWVYWFLMAIYFCLRKIMTGEYLGNWSGIVFHFPDNTSMIRAWIQSFKMIIAPISSAIFGHSSIITLFWVLVIFVLVCLTIYTAWKKPFAKRLLVFLICWFFISLLPMAKLLLITPDLLDARYGYMASIPLCILLGHGLALGNKPKFLKNWRYPIFNLLIVFSGLILFGNNMAWAEAGKLTNNMLGSFHTIHQQTPSDSKLYFVNIPLQYKGVPIAGLKTIDCMNYKPFADSNYDNCIWLLNEDQSLPIGLISNDLSNGKISSRFYVLNSVTKMFDQIKFDKLQEQYSKQIDMKFIGKKVASDRDVLSGKMPGFIFASSTDAQINCWNTDALVIKALIKEYSPTFKGGLASINFDCDNQPLVPEVMLMAEILPKKGEQLLILPLRGKPMWMLGGMCHSLSVKFPKGCVAQVISANAISIKNSMPRLSFVFANYNSQVGEVDLTRQCESTTIDYDAHCIEHCAGIVLEVISATDYFKELNSVKSDVRSLVDVKIMKPKGQIRLALSMFPIQGAYKVRLRAIDKLGNQCGYCSDHFILYASP